MTLALGISRELFGLTEADRLSKKELAEGNKQAAAQKVFSAKFGSLAANGFAGQILFMESIISGRGVAYEETGKNTGIFY